KTSPRASATPRPWPIPPWSTISCRTARTRRARRRKRARVGTEVSRLAPLRGGRAMRYPVGVGRAGKQWAGTKRIDGKYRDPAWSPPREVKRDRPNMPDVIPGGSPRNPMGVGAMTLSGGEYAIHGTNMPGSVGGFVSYGCIRMLNADISDLFGRVSVGTTVVVTR